MNGKTMMAVQATLIAAGFQPWAGYRKADGSYLVNCGHGTEMRTFTTTQAADDFMRDNQPKPFAFVPPTFLIDNQPVTREAWSDIFNGDGETVV